MPETNRQLQSSDMFTRVMQWTKTLLGDRFFTIAGSRVLHLADIYKCLSNVNQCRALS